MQTEKVFIQTNTKQLLGALLSKFSIERQLPATTTITVEILNSDEMDIFRQFAGETYTQKNRSRSYDLNDLQSFTFTRFMPPKRMGYQGRSIVIDPDVFALSDLTELMRLDLQGHAIAAYQRGKGFKSSVMLLDNAKLTHWDIESILRGLGDGTIDSDSLKSLVGEHVLPLTEIWNSFDHIDSNTKLVHMTKKIFQPWRTGLPVDFVVQKPMKPFFGIPREWIHRALGRYKAPPTHCLPHPDLEVEKFFFTLAHDALKEGAVEKGFVEAEIATGRIRSDFFSRLHELTCQ